MGRHHLDAAKHPLSERVHQHLGPAPNDLWAVGGSTQHKVRRKRLYAALAQYVQVSGTRAQAVRIIFVHGRARGLIGACFLGTAAVFLLAPAGYAPWRVRARPHPLAVEPRLPSRLLAFSAPGMLPFRGAFPTAHTLAFLRFIRSTGSQEVDRDGA